MKQFLWIVVLTVTTASHAFAQSSDSTSDPAIALARALYSEGVEAAGRDNWTTAHDRFKSSYELAPRVLTLFNLAVAQVQTGRLVEAWEGYRKFLRQTADGRYPDLRTTATSRIGLLEKQLAQIAFEIVNLDPRDAIVIDEARVSQLDLHDPIAVTPGRHVAHVRRGSTTLATRTVTLSPGAVESMHIELPALKPDLQLHAATDAAAADRAGVA